MPNTIVIAGRILLVDDQPANLRVVTTLLKRQGYEVATAAENIRRRLDHADAAWEVQASSLDNQLDDAMQSLEVEAALAERMNRLGV